MPDIPPLRNMNKIIHCISSSDHRLPAAARALSALRGTEHIIVAPNLSDGSGCQLRCVFQTHVLLFHS